MKNIKQSGFTLIETLIYLALFGMIFSGVIVCVFNILESSGRNQAKVMLQEDGNFIAAKINWALSQAQNITIPTAGDLQLATASGTLEFKPEVGVQNLLLLRNSNPGLKLNNSNEKVPVLFFVKIEASGDRPAGVNYGFTLTTLSSNGALLSDDFSSTVYLRK